MVHLLVVAHGSRREASNREIRTLVAGLQDSCTAFAGIECAFLEIAAPSIQEALWRLIDRGADDIVVLPYFLSAGRHVISDIPEQVDLVRAEAPGVKIKIAPYLGASDKIPHLLIQQAFAD